MISRAISLAKIRECYETIEKCANELEQPELAPMNRFVLPYVKEQYDIAFNEILPTAEAQLARRRMLEGEQRLALFQDNKMNEYELNVYRTILEKIVSWQFPVLEMFPGTGDMLPSVVGGEPLYVVDWDQTILDHVGLQFNEFFAERRLIRYKINGYDLKLFKPNTFGIVYNLHWTKFEDLENLTAMATNAFISLLPGGYYLFNYIPAETIWGLEEFAANNGFGAVTDHLLENLIEIGFEILNNRTVKGCSFVLCKKTGELSSPKASAITAKIIDSLL